MFVCVCVCGHQRPCTQKFPRQIFQAVSAPNNDSTRHNPDAPAGGRYGPRLDEPQSSTVLLEREEEEHHIFQAISFSRNLHTLVWANMPLTETMDIRPLLLVLGTTITHLGLYHSMPPGHFVVWLLLIANPCSRVCIYARMCSVGVCVSIRDRDRVTETHSSQIQRHRDVSTHVQKCHFWRFATDSLPTSDLGGQRLDVPSNRR